MKELLDMTAQRRKRKPRSQRTRVTDRDRQALELVARLRVVALDDLAVLLGAMRARPQLTVRATRMVVARWQRMGLAQTTLNPRGGNAVVVPTKDAWEWALGRVPASLGPPAWRDLPHALTVSAVAIDLLTTTRGAQWISEEELRDRTLTHCPDGALVLRDQRTFAIEVERVQKSSTRWKHIIGPHLAVWAGVAYYCSPATQSALTRWAETHLPTEDRGRLVICSLGRLAR
jgi:hypothetical protein